MTQDLYPECQVDVAVSDEDNIGRTELVGDDARGVGAPSVETLAPNLIGSSSAKQPHPPATDQVAATVPSGRGGGEQKKKHIALGTKRKHDKLPAIR
jgi:hypothetical protein